MANPEHLEIIQQGVAVWNEWRSGNPRIEPDLAGADLSGKELNEADFSETDLRKADLKNSTFRGAKLIKTDLRGADLRKASFNLANLSEANLSEAVLRGTDFSEAVLKRAYLIRADLVRADLFEADLERADFRWAFLIGTDLTRANLSRADFRWAYLIEANLTEADLSEANLMEANLSKADLRRVNFRDASVGWSYFGDLDLSLAKGLHTIKHFGPSTVGIDTLHRSKGTISKEFLQGAGVPEIFIEFMSALTHETFTYHSSFISYSSKDRDFAQRLHADLKNNGVYCWLLPEEMKIGDKIQHDIEPSIRIHDKLVLVFSENSVGRQWMEKEAATALEEEIKKKKKVLIPVRLDSAVLESDQAWTVDLRSSREIYDFSKWQGAVFYQNAFDRLLEHLRADG
jgi:uncharacterized protein YjbI with pentapeptide repeats